MKRAFVFGMLMALVPSMTFAAPKLVAPGCPVVADSLEFRPVTIPGQNQKTPAIKININAQVAPSLPIQSASLYLMMGVPQSMMADQALVQGLFGSSSPTAAVVLPFGSPVCLGSIGAGAFQASASFSNKVTSLIQQFAAASMNIDGQDKADWQSAMMYLLSQSHATQNATLTRPGILDRAYAFFTPLLGVQQAHADGLDDFFDTVKNSAVTGAGIGGDIGKPIGELAGVLEGVPLAGAAGEAVGTLVGGAIGGAVGIVKGGFEAIAGLFESDPPVHKCTCGCGPTCPCQCR